VISDLSAVVRGGYIRDVAETLDAWEFDRELGPQLAAGVALDQLAPADVEVVQISARGDVITVQIVEGAVLDPASVLYVAGRGLFEILRLEAWPPVAGGEARVLLTLKAWPAA
jgi:hypothetical protein